MNKIITIGREFGSGGRELGRRLAEYLGFEYYDREIITEIAKRSEMSEKYVQQVIDSDPHSLFPITIGHTFAYINNYAIDHQQEVYRHNCDVLKSMAEKSNCVIVGSCADYILKEYNPYKIFVYAESDSKLARCRSREAEKEHLSDKKLKKFIKNVDKNRARFYEFYTGNVWGDKVNYDIMVNTSNVEIKKLIPMLAKMFKD